MYQYMSLYMGQYTGQVFSAGLPKMFMILFCSILLLTVGTGVGFSQDGSGDVNFDDLFSDPDGGIIETPAAGGSGTAGPSDGSGSEDLGPPLDLDRFTTSTTPRIRGSVKLEGGAGVGLTQWPGTPETQGFEPLDYFGYTFGYTLNSGVTIDVRPTGRTRFFTSIGASLNPSTLDIDGPSISELFVDYTLNDAIFLRVGKQSLTWGQGRLIGNPGNLVNRVKDGASVRAFFPLGTNGLTTLVYGTEDFGPVSPRTLAYAAQFDTTIGGFVTGLSAHYRYSEDLQAVWYGRTTIGSVDSAIETRVDWDIEGAITDGASGSGSGFDQVPRVRALTSFFWEGGSPRWIILGEYLFDSSVPDFRGHTAGLGIAITGLPWGGWRPGVSWRHTIADHSGQVLLGLEGPLAPSLRGAFAVPVVYGPAGSTFRTSDTELGSMVTGVAFRVTLSMQF